jgi:CRISPR-associated protein Cmr1
METVTATYRIVTPMFIGGADQSPGDGIRPPSVKGALRFWWRALNWGRFRSEPGATDISALKALHAEEAGLFGRAADTVKGNQIGGQGCFLLTVRQDKRETTEKKKGIVHPNFKPTKIKNGNDGRPLMRNGSPEIDENHLAPARYLGYGLMTAFTSKDKETKKIKAQAGQLDRGCLDENQTFTLTLTFRDKIDDSVLNALKAMGLLGGLGSRSRHGMGSIALEKIVDDKKNEINWTAPADQKDYVKEVEKLLGSFAAVPEPDYSAFSKESRVDVLLSAYTPYKVLDQFGMKMLDYRSWGKSGKVLGKNSEKRFDKDHSWCKNKKDLTSKKKWREIYPNFHPRRVMFGLPHDYGKTPDQKVNAATHERRASPLLFHVHRLSDNEYIGVSVLLKSRFLPDGEKINAGGKNVTAKVDDWAVITDFLNGRVGDTPTTPKPEAPFRFQNKTAVLP